MPDVLEPDVLEPDVLELDAQICFSVYATALAFGKTYAPLLAELGLTYPQYLVMLVLWTQDGLAVRAIGERLHLDSGTLTPLLKRLEAAGFVQRQRDTRDERMVRTVLTAAGRALRTRAELIPCAMEQAMGLPPSRLAELRQDLDALRMKLEAAAGGASP